MADQQIDKTRNLGGIFARLTRPDMTYNVFGGTLNLAQSNPREPNQMNFDFMGFSWSRSKENSAARSLMQEDRRVSVDWMHMVETGQVS